MDLKLAAQVAEGAARSAGALARSAFRRTHQVSYKGIDDPVTETDKASEALIVNVLRAAFPTHNVFGEENGHTRTSDQEPTWWIDPIDGTYAFVRGIPQFTISLGCVDANGKPLVGVVYDPMMDECYTAIQGGGAFCNGEPIKVTTAAALRESFASNNNIRNASVVEWTAMLPRCHNITRMGSAALSLCYVACGRLELYWQRGLSGWDIAAGLLIVQEAGGRVTDYAGQPLDLQKKGSLLASNGAVHTEAVGVLSALPDTPEIEIQRISKK